MRIHIVTNATTMQYHDYCIDNHKMMAADPLKLEFFSHCLDDLSYNSTKSRTNAIRIPSNTGSVAHAVGVNSMLKNMDPHSINVIADSDSIVLLKGWDEKISSLCEKYGAVGVTYEDIGGFSSGDGPVQTYKKLPNVTWCAFSNRFTFDFDAMCDKTSNLQIDSEELSTTFNLPIGKSLLREPAWQLPLFLKKNNIPSLGLNFVRPRSGNAKAVLTNEDYHTEYQLEDGTPIVAHQRGSMSKAFKTHHLSKSFYEACETYITKG